MQTGLLLRTSSSASVFAVPKNEASACFDLGCWPIAEIRARTDVEVEVFVHGALCISYSGQCMTSEAIGGPSSDSGAAGPDSPTGKDGRDSDD